MKNHEKRRNASLGAGDSPLGAEKRLVIRFETFTLDLQRRLLHRGDYRVHLTPKPLETLIYLLQNPGRTVQKRELLDAVWKQSYVSEDTLVHAIREIRRKLGDEVVNPRFIQTVPREGYRFVGSVALDSATEPISDQERRPPEAGPHFQHVSNVEKRKRWAWFLIAVLPVIGLALIFLVTKSGVDPRARSAEQPPPPVVDLKPHTLGMFSAVKPAVSPDGKHLLYVALRTDQAQTMDLYMTPLDGSNVLPITEHANPSGDMPAFTTNGSHIVFSRYRSGDDGSTVPDLWIAPTFGRASKLFLRQARGAGFSPDGEYVGYTSQITGTKVLVISRLNRLDEQKHVSASGFSPRWSPDGKWIAYTTSDPEGGVGHLWIVSNSLSERRRLTREASQIYGLSWAPNGRSIIFASAQKGVFHLYRVFLEDRSTMPLTTGVGDYFSPSVTPDGKNVFFCHTKTVRDLTLVDGLTRKSTKQVTHDELHLWPRLSPSATRVVTISRRSDCYECLSVTDLNTGQSKLLTNQAAFHPSWLDEDNVAYLQSGSSPDKTVASVVHVSTGVSSLWTQFSTEARWLAPHPGGKQLAIVLQPPHGPAKIVLRDLDRAADSDRILVEGAEYHQLRWSPDGNALAWSGPEVSASAQSSGIWLLNLDQKAPRQVCQDGYAPVWIADGRILYFSRFHRVRGQAGLWALDLQRHRLNKLRSWYLVHHYDIVGERLTYAPVTNLSQIYSMPLP